MKKINLLLFIFNCTYQNIWDNLYSNTSIKVQQLPSNIQAYLQIEDSYLFSSVNIVFDIDPIQNTFYLNLLYNEISIGQLLINFNEQSFMLYSKKRGCFKTKFPSIFKLNLGNIHNLWKFSTFNQENNQYEFDLKFLGMDRTKMPETILVYKEDEQGRQVLQKIQMIFITQKLVLLNMLQEDHKYDEVFKNKLNEQQFCVEFSFKNIRKKFADIFLSDLINKTYEKLIGYQQKFIGNQKTNEN